MAGWWDKIKSLLSSSEKSSSTQPAVHEIISRSEAFKADYEIWKNGPVHKKLLYWISDQYHVYQQENAALEKGIDFLSTDSTKGVALHFDDIEYNKEDARFLFDYFKEKIRTHNYRTQVSDTRTYSKNTWIETVERHYLKPRPVYDEQGKIDQGFGNITVLLTFRNDKVYNLKLSATAYQDRLFNAEKKFSALMKFITF